MAPSQNEPAPLPLTRIMVRPLGSPLPLGFFAFGIGMVLTCCLEMSILPASSAHGVALVLLTFVAPLELLGAVIAFLARDTAGCTTLAIFGGSWVTFGVSSLTARASESEPALGVFFLAAAAAMIMLAIVAARAKPFFTALLATSFCRYVLAGLGLVTGSSGLGLAAAIVGWVLVAVAFYGALALLLEDIRQKAVLPLFRRDAARTAIEGDLGSQLQHIPREAGVRQQL